MSGKEMRSIGRLVFVVVLLVGLALLVHMSGMDAHGMSMLGTCLAVLQTIFFSFFLAFAWAHRPVESTAVRPASVASPLLPTGRYPPDEGTVLRH